MVLALIATFLVAGIGGAIAVAAGTASEELEDSRVFLQLGTLAQGLIFVATAIFLAGRTLRPRAWHFGLRRTRLWPTVGWAALGFVAYWFLVFVYVALVQPDAEQETLEDLGTEEGTGWIVAAAVLVIVVAPIVEEFFFRGFFYRALRTKLPIAASAALVGVLFGFIHITSTPLEIIAPLVFLGVIFCLVYEKTATLFSVIGLHALNNTLALGAGTGEWAIAGIVGVLMLAGCLVAPRRLSPTPAPAAA
jgi:membrane protease YdiL (CAAX protease family)